MRIVYHKCQGDFTLLSVQAIGKNAILPVKTMRYYLPLLKKECHMGIYRLSSIQDNMPY